MTSSTAAGTSASRLAALHLRRDKDADFTISCQVEVFDISIFRILIYIYPIIYSSALYKNCDAGKDTDFTLSFQGNIIAAHSYLLAST